MSDDRLREAALVLRERSNAATPGPWEGGERCVWSSADTPDGVVVGDAPSGSGGVEYATDADYIATMHPGVALALADWLDAESLICCEPGDRVRRASVHVADLILGTPDMTIRSQR